MTLVKLSKTKFGINLGFLSIDSEWEIDETQKNASWEMYVELITRISTAPLEPGEGLLREALSSLYSLFGTTREILRKYGPPIATPGNPDDITFGHLAVAILNKVLRPVLAKWHPQLKDWEDHRPKDLSVTAHEAAWPQNEALRSEINKIRGRLMEYANVLAEVSGVAKLTDYPSES
ncbi:MAG: hypothetical protein R3D00_26890 [Bacteroidia bacterium]